ncbi:hypothetical protein Cni_G06601 [Canna indica]|uniref:Zinc knuckle CX2CX4HX4C domain-containing protein n=1 Tax=Canna indica TaxID=4628 RepID=A0AAQ3JXA6_9LILI|nr:hypothetical protein Cni_G06601 [Canna indica]
MIANSLGKLISIDNRSFEFQRGRYIRVCVEIDLSLPINQGVWISIPGDKFFQPVVYENLPLVYFLCGLVGHKKNSCPKKNDHPMASTPSEVPPSELVNEDNVKSNNCLDIDDVVDTQAHTNEDYVYGPWVQVRRRRERRNFPKQQPYAPTNGVSKPLKETNATSNPFGDVQNDTENNAPNIGHKKSYFKGKTHITNSRASRPIDKGKNKILENNPSEVSSMYIEKTPYVGFNSLNRNLDKESSEAPSSIYRSFDKMVEGVLIMFQANPSLLESTKLKSHKKSNVRNISSSLGRVRKKLEDEGPSKGKRHRSGEFSFLIEGLTKHIHL